MKISVAALLSIAVASVSAAPLEARAATVSYMAGFNLGAQTTSNACKTTAQYQSEFEKIKNTYSTSSATFDTIKIYSTSDCNALLTAVPAAQAAGVKLWAGVWEIDQTKFDNEKAALESAIRQYGHDWLAGVNVGSEALYRKEITASDLATKIYDVKGMVQQSLGASNVPVGCADTWNSWVDGANAAVIAAVDVVMMNGFPYWQGATIEQSLATFQTAVTNTKNAIGSKPLMIGETGWPTVGPNYGSSVASNANLQKFWKDTACWLINQKIGWFWFSAFNEPQKTSTIEQNFGVGYSDGTLKISLTC